MDHNNNLTSPLHRVNSALQHGTNISKSEIIKWLVFPDTVIIIVLHVSATPPAALSLNWC